MAITQLATANEATFARHETFHPRYGWLRKAVIHAATDPGIFVRPDATVVLGVGKNMVSAIRFWGLAFKLLQTAPNPDRPRLPNLVPSDRGRSMFLDGGWDPYLECSATLWILHWWLLTPPTRVPIWWLAFNALTAMQFTDASLAGFATNAVEATGGWADVLTSSIKKDVDCLIRMYAPRRDMVNDDLVDSPFRELGLIDAVLGASRTYRFVVGAKDELPDAALAYSCLDFMARRGSAATISIARLAEDVGSPGQVFKLTEVDIYQSLVRLSRNFAKLGTAEPAGVKQLLVDGPAAVVAGEVLENYYAAAGQSRDEAVDQLDAEDRAS